MAVDFEGGVMSDILHETKWQSKRIKQLEQENKELRTRVAEQEKLIEWHKTDTHDAMEWKNELQTRLSTLLKASEGMEKALERIVEIPDQTDYEEDPCGQVNAMHEKATKALADFRALKETMEKGA